MGCSTASNYKRHDYEETVKNLTHGEGVDAVFEMLGGEHTAKSLRCLRDFGKVIQYGTATGAQPKLDVRALYAKSASVQGLWLTYLSQKPEIMGPAWQQLSGWIKERKLTPQIGQVFPFERAVEAYKLLEQGKNYGKVILEGRGIDRSYPELPRKWVPHFSPPLREVGLWFLNFTLRLPQAQTQTPNYR